MKLFYKEIRELMAPVAAAALLLFAAGALLQSAAHWEHSGFVVGLEVIRFIICISLCSVFGALTFAGDRERGTMQFLNALPVTPDAMFYAKTTAGLTCVAVIMLSYYPVAVDSGMYRWWPAFLLSFAIGQISGLVLGHSVNASALSAAIGLAVITMLAGNPVFPETFRITSLSLLAITAGLLVTTRCLMLRFNNWQVFEK